VLVQLHLGQALDPLRHVASVDGHPLPDLGGGC
jgi:hypothetical protein